MFDPQFDPDNNDSNFQSLVERMIKAGWIAGAHVTPKTLAAVFTDLGEQRFEEARAIFKETLSCIVNAKAPFDPGLMNAINERDLGQFKSRICAVVTELRPPPFSIGENDTLLCLFLEYARKKAGEEPPFGRFCSQPSL